MMQRFLRLPRQERVALVVALVLAALASVGQGIQFFTEDYNSYSTGMLVVIILSGLAGVALVFEADEFPDTLDATDNHARTMKFVTSVKHVLVVCGIEFVLGEALFLIGLATHAPGINGDISVILAPLLIGVLMGGMFCLIGTLAGFLVAWPLVKLVAFGLGRRSSKPVNPIGPALGLLFLTIVAFAILGVIGANPPDAVGSPTGRGLYGIVYLYVMYSGSAPQQAAAWIARSLGVVIVLEVIWIRRVGHVHGIGENMTVDPPQQSATE
jgi:hypothetical protein